MKKKIIKIIVILIFFKLLITNFWKPAEIYWNSFDFDLKNREYLIEDEDGCEILEIGKSKDLDGDKVYYGKVASGGIALAPRGESDFFRCEEKYFVKGVFSLDFYDNKEELLKNIKSKEYRVIKPQIFFLVSFY